MNAARVVAFSILAFGLGCLVNLRPEVKPNVRVDAVNIELPAWLLKRAGEQQPAVVAAVPVAVEASRPRIGERLLVKLVRHRVGERLQRDGFALVGGDKTPLKPEQVEKLLAQLDDETILQGAHEKGALPAGTVLDKLTALLDWIVAHESQITAIIKWVMALLMMFGV